MILGISLYLSGMLNWFITFFFRVQYLKDILPIHLSFDNKTDYLIQELKLPVGKIFEL